MTQSDLFNTTDLLLNRFPFNYIVQHLCSPQKRALFEEYLKIVVPFGSKKKAMSASELGYGAADARGPLFHGQLRSLLPDGNLLPTLRVTDYWVVEGEEGILWLPPDYRSIHEAI